MNDHKPHDFYSNIQRRTGVSADFIRPLRVTNALADVSESVAVVLIREMCETFGPNLTATLLQKHSPQKCREALERMMARFVHLKNACEGCLETATANQMVVAHTEFLFVDFEPFLAALENLKRLIPDPSIRSIFLSGHPQYFMLPIAVVSAGIENGLTIASCDGRCDALWTRLSALTAPDTSSSARPSLTLVKPPEPELPAAPTTAPQPARVNAKPPTRVRKRNIAPPTPIFTELSKTQAPAKRTDINKLRQAFAKAGWSTQRRDEHFTVFPFLQEMPAMVLQETMATLANEFDLCSHRFTRQLRRNTLQTLLELNTLRLLSQSANNAKILITPDVAKVREREIKSFVIAAHRVREDQIEGSLSLLLECGFDTIRAPGFLAANTELLGNFGRPIDTLRQLVRLCPQGVGAVKTQLENPSQRAVLFEDPERLNVEERIAETRRILSVVDDALPNLECERLDPAYDWRRLFFPLDELAFRLFQIFQHGMCISVVFAEKVRSAVFLPTRLLFFQELDALKRATQKALREADRS